MNVCNTDMKTVLLLKKKSSLPFRISIDFNTERLVFVHDVRYEGELGVEWMSAAVTLILSWAYDLHIITSRLINHLTIIGVISIIYCSPVN